MNCMPTKVQNERCAIEPFVRCFNEFYSREFTFQCVPDQEDRTRPQPDALYKTHDGDQLAIERKTFVDPDHMKRHKWDHNIMSYLWSHLPAEISKGPYVLHMPFLHSATKYDEIESRAKEVCDFISGNLETIRGEGELAFESDDRQADYLLVHKSHGGDWDEYYHGPWEGLYISMSLGSSSPWYWDQKTSEWAQVQVQKALRATGEKFRGYENACKVLLIERGGNIGGPTCRQLERLIGMHPKPSLLDEIWDAWIDTPDYCEPSWCFTRIWSSDPLLPQGWIHPSLFCKQRCHCHADPEPQDVSWYFTEDGMKGKYSI